MGAADPRPQGSRRELLLDHVTALDAEPRRPTARERLERLLGGYLTSLLLGALTGGRKPRAADAD
jgi:hypothetical protein